MTARAVGMTPTNPLVTNGHQVGRPRWLLLAASYEKEIADGLYRPPDIGLGAHDGLHWPPASKQIVMGIQ